MENTLNKSELENEHPPQRDRMGRLMPGHGVGRKKGSISAATALRDRFIQTVIKLDRLKKYNGDYVFHYAQEQPEKFLQMLVTLLPRHLKVEQDHTHVHIPVMSLPEVERARVFEDCRRRVTEIRGIEVVEKEDVPVLKS